MQFARRVDSPHGLLSLIAASFGEVTVARRNNSMAHYNKDPNRRMI
jgi:hypothetical protein